MPAMFTVALTADLHYGTRHPAGAAATRDLLANLHAAPPDLLILAGDIGAGDEFERCLEQFERVQWNMKSSGKVRLGV